jgi:hypothetical protein
MGRRLSKASAIAIPAMTMDAVPSKEGAKSIIFEKEKKVADARAGFDSKYSNKLHDVSRRMTVSGGSTGFQSMLFQGHNPIQVNESPSQDHILSKAPKDATSPRRSSIFKNPTVQHNWHSVSPPAN